MTWLVTLSPWMRGAYIVLSLGVAVGALYVMEQLHTIRHRVGARRVPFNLMRGLMLTLAMAVSTVILYTCIPDQRGGLPTELIVALRLRDLAGIGAVVCYVVGVWQMFYQSGPQLRERVPTPADFLGAGRDLRPRPPTWHRESG